MPEGPGFAAFIDRDGTVCFDKHYLSDPDGLELIPTVAEGIRRLNDCRIPVIMVTNQSGIGRGFFSEDTLRRIHERLKKMLQERSAMIDDIFYCPHVPDSGCPCRKPEPGMLLQAERKHGFDLSKSYVIGDRMMDIEMAHKVKAIGILVPEPGDQYHVDKEIGASTERPDFRAKTFLEAAEWLLVRSLR